MDRRAHWEHVYTTKRSDEVSWYQRDPALSLRFIQQVAPDRTARIIDVGGGASLLVDRLLQHGYFTLTVLDISGAALTAARTRLPGPEAARVTWIEADVLTAELAPYAFDVWHDRAVFHFLTDAADRIQYVAQLRRALRPGGHLVIATFAVDGPRRCSGLEVARYDAAGLQQEFGAGFRLLASEREAHVTPSGQTQHFQYGVLERVDQG